MLGAMLLHFYLTHLLLSLHLAGNVYGMRNGRRVFQLLNRSYSTKTVSGTSSQNKNRFSSICYSSQNMMELNHDFFGENVAFGKDFHVAWDNIVKAVRSDERKLYLVSDFDHTLTTFASKYFFFLSFFAASDSEELTVSLK